MPVVCRDYDLLFAHIPKTGGTFVEGILSRYLGGERVGNKHHSFRSSNVPDPPSIRAFAVREPLSWYRSYWAWARGVTKRPAAWPIWEAGNRRHPTNRLDKTGGAPTFEGFIAKVIREFPNGYVRSMYCDFLNGSTHAVRTSHLHEDLAHLLRLVGYENPDIVESRKTANVGERTIKDKATLSPELEAQIVEIDNLGGLAIPYISEM